MNIRHMLMNMFKSLMGMHMRVRCSCIKLTIIMLVMSIPMGVPMFVGGSSMNMMMLVLLGHQKKSGEHHQG